MKTKICTKCGEPKPEICFAIRKSSKDGLQAECRECSNKKQNERLREKRVAERADQPPLTKLRARRWATLTSHNELLPHDPYKQPKPFKYEPGA